MGRTMGPQRGPGWGLQTSLVPGGPEGGQGARGLGLGPIVNPQAIVMLPLCTRRGSGGQSLWNYA